jgi:uncharacterized protein YaaW (UPF0174 family)
MRNYKKYLLEVYEKLNNETQEKKIRYIVESLMLYLENKHLLDKMYLDHQALFVQCETYPNLIESQSVEMMLTFLTIIYRTDYLSPDSDAYIMYYRNGMLMRILKHLILGLDV